MKLIIPSYGRAETITTPEVFASVGDLRGIVVVHNKAEEEAYKQAGRLSGFELVVSNQPIGVSKQRQWIIDNLIEEGEWFVTADDNITGLTAVEMPHWEIPVLPVKEAGGFQEVYANKIGVERFEEIVKECIEKAEHVKAAYCGFATTSNYYFRGKKWRFVGYVISKLALIKKVGIEYDQKVLAMDDYAYTAECLKWHGVVLINNYLFPTAGHYEKGGIGTYEERTPMKILDCFYLMKKYPGLFRYKKKAGTHPRAELQIRFTNPKQVLSWRRKLAGKR